MYCTVCSEYVYICMYIYNSERVQELINHSLEIEKCNQLVTYQIYITTDTHTYSTAKLLSLNE